MNVLILYSKREKTTRATHDNHLYSFARYVNGHAFFYLNVLEKESIQRVQRFPFDAVILHYTFLALRWDPENWHKLYGKIKDTLASLSGYKVMLPQDDYHYSEDLWSIIRDCEIDHVFSVLPENQLVVAYPPDRIGRTTVSTVLTGYVDESSILAVAEMKKTCVRNIDIGYRARKLPYEFGHFGQLKIELKNAVKERLVRYPDIIADLENTEQERDVFLGNDWMRFLLSCRCQLGCLGGSSILDPDGEIVKRVDKYCKAHPCAKYEEVKAACFPNDEDTIRGYAPSPRLFECAMTKTCQLLVEGDYYGIVKPGIDYIEIKQDFSNLDAVLEKVRDKAYCERIAEQCYMHVIQPGNPDNPYTYRAFANHVIDHISSHVNNKNTRMPVLILWHTKRCCAYYSSQGYLRAYERSENKQARKTQKRLDRINHKRIGFRFDTPSDLASKMFSYIWTVDGRKKIWKGMKFRFHRAK